jgi:hypothetical protein
VITTDHLEILLKPASSSLLLAVFNATLCISKTLSSFFTFSLQVKDQKLGLISSHHGFHTRFRLLPPSTCPSIIRILQETRPVWQEVRFFNLVGPALWLVLLSGLH